MLYWFLQASRFGRYSGSGTTSLEEDLRDVATAHSYKEAIASLMGRVGLVVPLGAEDFLRDYSDSRFGRFLLYLLVFQRKAQDWDDAGQRIGFQGLDILADFRPQWHHIFPRKLLDGRVAEEKTNALANIAVIGPGINIRISSKSPMDYISRYGISETKLEQQFILPQVAKTPVEEFEQWLHARAVSLAEASNDFLLKLQIPLQG